MDINAAKLFLKICFGRISVGFCKCFWVFGRFSTEDIQDFPDRREALESDPESSKRFLPTALFLSPKLLVTIPRRPDRCFQRSTWIPNASKFLPKFERSLNLLVAPVVDGKIRRRVNFCARARVSGDRDPA